jgi:hypothetical protein
LRNIIMGLVLTVLGIGFSIWGYGVMKITTASLKWPTTRALIVHSQIKSTSVSGEAGYQHSADITYKYTVNGKEHTSNKIIAGDYSSNSSSRAQKIIRQYREGSYVEAYYNPERPSEAVLIPGGSKLIYIPFGFGILAVCSGVVALIYYRKKKVSVSVPESN